MARFSAFRILFLSMPCVPWPLPQLVRVVVIFCFIITGTHTYTAYILNDIAHGYTGHDAIVASRGSLLARSDVIARPGNASLRLGPVNATFRRVPLVYTTLSPPSGPQLAADRTTGPSALDRMYSRKYPGFPRRSSACDGTQGAGSDFTMVTALLDLRREQWPGFRRTFEDYLHHATHVFNLHVPMVIFVESKVEDFVRYHRQGKDHITHIIRTTIDELELYREFQRVRTIMESEEFKEGHPYIRHPEGFSPLYNVVVNSKSTFLHQAAARDHFRTKYFYWIDAGYGHGADIFPQNCFWAPRNAMDSRDVVSFILLNPISMLKDIDDLYKVELPPFVNGGFYGGTQSAVTRYYAQHKRAFYEFLDEGRVDDDQTLIVASWFKDKSLFRLVTGWWYDGFSLFG